MRATMERAWKLICSGRRRRCVDCGKRRRVARGKDVGGMLATWCFPCAAAATPNESVLFVAIKPAR